MMLSELITEATIPVDVAVHGISDDSRRTQPGDLFCAVRGDNFDGRAFAGDAIEKGAVAIVCDPPGFTADVPVVEIEKLRDSLGDIAGRVYGEPSRGIDMIAVTGTNGKTSFTHLLSQALTTGKRKAGLIGTMGHGVPGHLVQPGLTTPPAVDLQRRVKELVDAGCRAVVLEASSHGLAQGRLNGLFVDTAVFTNLTHDHLDYHETLSSYQDAKGLLFGFESLSNAVVNLDDEFARELLAGLSPGVRLVRFSRLDESAEVYCSSTICTPDGVDVALSVSDKIIEARLPLFGLFNVENLLAVIATLVAMEMPLQDIEAALKSLTPVAGRMDVVNGAGKPTIIVDYAHTPDALEKCLRAVSDHFSGCRIHCVFGCGGDRDQAKRPMMGEIASRLADRIILTSDNPRSEDPEHIIDDIKSGVSKEFETFVDRSDAIRAAIAAAGIDEVVLVAGKGHEDYQELASGRVPFSDYEVIEEALDAWVKNDGREE